MAALKRSKVPRVASPHQDLTVLPRVLMALFAGRRGGLYLIRALCGKAESGPQGKAEKCDHGVTRGPVCVYWRHWCQIDGPRVAG